MKPLLLHDTVRQAFERFAREPSHALLLVAPTGTGKAAAARDLASQMLQTETEKLLAHPYFKIFRPKEGKALPVGDIRELIRFTTLRAKGKGDISRVAVIEDSHALTIQAQNALLKTIEEPPLGTALILTAAHEQALLPTIRSRTQLIHLQSPASTDLISYFVAEGHGQPAVQKALLMSGGLPGLMCALLETDTQHSLFQATTIAHDILRKTSFERLVLVDDIAKQRQLLLDILFMIQQMADVAMRQSQDPTKIRRWHHILTASNATSRQIFTGAQPKLALTNFMLAL